MVSDASIRDARHAALAIHAARLQQFSFPSILHYHFINYSPLRDSNCLTTDKLTIILFLYIILLH